MAEKKKLGAYENPRYIDNRPFDTEVFRQTMENISGDAGDVIKAMGDQDKLDKEREKQRKSDTTEKELEYKDLDRRIDAKTKTEKPAFGDNLFNSTRPEFSLQSKEDDIPIIGETGSMPRNPIDNSANEKMWSDALKWKSKDYSLIGGYKPTWQNK